MSRSAPRHAAPKHARTSRRAASAAAGSAPATDLGPVRHHATTPVRAGSGPSRTARIAAVTAAVVAVAGGSYVLSEASPAAVVASGPSSADIIVVTMSPTQSTSPTPSVAATAATPAVSATATPTPSLTPMHGAGTVELTPDTLAARKQAAEAADAARVAKARAAAAAAAQAKARAAAATAAAQAKARADDAARAGRSAGRAPLPTGSPKAIARAMLANYGWGDDQFSCLVTMWNHESGWNPHAENPGSGAYGIPQALPGAKMGTSGSDWRNNPATQISWGLNYIKTRYNTPCGAWSFWQRGSWH